MRQSRHTAGKGEIGIKQLEARSLLPDRVGQHPEAAEWIVNNVPIDYEAAAKELVRLDGAGRWLSYYDGETHETISGFVYWWE